MSTFGYYIIELPALRMGTLRLEQKMYLKISPEIYPEDMQTLINGFGVIKTDIDSHDKFVKYLEKKGYQAEELDICWVDGRKK